MPRRGYRKGISDTRTPRPHLLRCRASDHTRRVLTREANSRAITLSALMAEIIDAFAADRPLELPHPRNLSNDAIYQLERLANNVNQIARAANRMKLHLLEAEARRTLARLHNLLDTLL